MTARILTPTELELLTLVQNELVPAFGALPAAGTLGAASTVDGYLAERPGLRRPVLSGLRAIEIAAADQPLVDRDPADRVNVLQQAEADAPEARGKLRQSARPHERHLGVFVEQERYGRTMRHFPTRDQL